ncbi:MAG: efflux transporter outer membrane subunit [Chromatiales bacterium]|jgi:NodT family efflux transporter outer membrane factor (OMF) lipoprotein|nr:efflux transporter outer membrane subunit [Chromatiales bacterium]
MTLSTFKQRMFPRSTVIALAVLATGCASFKPLPPQSGVETPAAWSMAGEQSAVNTVAWPAADWWRSFGSAELDRLIMRARVSNPDLGAAYQRILQARAQAKIVGATLYPQLDLGADAARQGVISASGSNSFALSLGASYEVDLWGRNHADRTAARAQVEASEFNRATVALTLTAGVANSYLQVLSLRQRLAIAQQNLKLAEDVLAVVEARARYGSASPLELAQQRAAVATQRITLPVLEQQEREARATLAVLLGVPAQGFDVQAQGLDGLLLPQAEVGLPSELLQRRPDIRSAEMQLIVAQADIAIARAAMFPSLRLNGSLATRGDSLSALFSQDPAYSIAAALTMPIFNAGRLAAARDVAKARHEELLLNYRSAILAALSDVDVVISNLDALEKRARWQFEARQQAEIALELAKVRYQAGATDLLTVLDAQRTLYQARDQEAQLHVLRLQAVVELYRALGGGWSESARDSDSDSELNS